MADELKTTIVYLNSTGVAELGGLGAVSHMFIHGGYMLCHELERRHDGFFDMLAMSKGAEDNGKRFGISVSIPAQYVAFVVHPQKTGEPVGFRTELLAENQHEPPAQT